MASTGEAWRLSRRPALDGLRGVAVLLVIAEHARIPWAPAGGTVGVTAFFALSGFLITALLLEEHADRGRVSLRGFYVRRARRLLPALFAVVIVTLTVSLLWLPISGVVSSVIAVTYLANWAMIPAMSTDALQHTWSLSVEEQFYVLWPLVVIGCATRWGRRGVGVAAVGGAGVSLLLAFALWDGGDGLRRVYYGSDTRAFALLAGCALAVALTSGRLRGQYRPGLVVAAVAGLVVVGYWPAAADLHLWLPVAATVLALPILWASSMTDRGWLSAPWLSWIGRRSYGAYLWHYPVVMAMRHHELPAEALLIFAATLILTWASWRWIESPWLSSSRTCGRNAAATSTVGSGDPNQHPGRRREGTGVRAALPRP